MRSIFSFLLFFAAASAFAADSDGNPNPDAGAQSILIPSVYVSLHSPARHTPADVKQTVASVDPGLNTKLPLSKFSPQPDFSPPSLEENKHSYATFGSEAAVFRLFDTSSTTLRVFGTFNSPLTEQERLAKPYVRGAVHLCRVDEPRACPFFSIIALAVSAHATPSFSINSDDLNGPFKSFDLMLVGRPFVDGKSRNFFPVVINEQSFVLSYDLHQYDTKLQTD
jgi:hypothetical protein